MPAADVEAVLAGEADVEDDEARPQAADVVERLLAAAHPLDAVAGLLEVRADERADRLLVLDEEQRRPGGGRRHQPVARTSEAGWSPSRTTVAIMPRRSCWKAA